MISDEINHSSVMGENDLGIDAPKDYDVSAVGDENAMQVSIEPEETEFIIDQEEFEKEYEVT